MLCLVFCSVGGYLRPACSGSCLGSNVLNTLCSGSDFLNTCSVHSSVRPEHLFMFGEHCSEPVLVHIWPYMAIYGHIYDHIWPYMTIYGHIYGRIYGHIYGHIWPYIWPYMAIYMAIYGHTWPYIWPYMAIYGHI